MADVKKSPDEAKATDTAPGTPETSPAPDLTPGLPKEIGGREGPEPTRFGDWEKNGIISDF